MKKSKGNYSHNVGHDVPSIESAWIPISDNHDNLPKGEVLACDEYGEMMFGYLSDEDGEVICENDGMVMYEVAAWMRKPKFLRETKMDDDDPCKYCKETNRCYDCPMGPRGPMIYEWGDD